MRLVPFVLIATELLALTSIGVSAQTPVVEITPIPVMAKPDFSKMFVGAWHCVFTSERRPAPVAQNFTASISPDGYWLVTNWVVAKTLVSPEFHSTERVTYDPSTRRWIDAQTDDQGGYEIATSPRWHGNTLVWTDVLAPKSDGIASTNPTTITRVSATQYTSRDSFIEPSGRLVREKWVCTKV